MQMMHDGAPPPPSWRGERSIAGLDRRENARLARTERFSKLMSVVRWIVPESEGSGGERK